MADQKVTELTEDTAPTVDDLLYGIQSPGGTPADRKIQIGTLLGVQMQNYLSGLYISNNATDATNDIDISSGCAADSGNAYLLVRSSTLTKRLDAAWAVGTNQGGLDTGSIANTTYYVWLIRRTDTGVVDALFSTSSTSPTMPSNYTQKRLIGKFVRASGAITAFTAVSSIDDHLRGLTASAGQTANFIGLDILPYIYPVGSIYITTVSTNPGTLLGFGTWTAFATGRTLVGIDTGQTEFDTVEETGGSKTHTLTTNEIPSHTHAEKGDYNTATISLGSGSTQLVFNNNVDTGATGGGAAHNNLQPYIVVYMWKRTA